MSDETLKELARRAVACEGWRWMEGMVAVTWPIERPLKSRVVAKNIDGYPLWLLNSRYHQGYDFVSKDALPDLNDPATLGCLLELVRKAWGDPNLYIMVAPRLNDSQPIQWAVCRGDGSPIMAGSRFDTEVHALVAALEVADE